MANINVTITYDPTQLTGSKWSQSGGSTIHVNERGNNPIGWSIQLKSGVAGSIDFSTDDASPGIVFIGTPAWPGTTPSGNANNWNSSLNNTLNPTDPSQAFQYKVNAMYTAPGKGAALVVWDPEVEEDPPPMVNLAGK